MIPLETLRRGLRADTLTTARQPSVDRRSGGEPAASCLSSTTRRCGAQEILRAAARGLPRPRLARLLVPEGGGGPARHAARARPGRRASSRSTPTCSSRRPTRSGARSSAATGSRSRSTRARRSRRQAAVHGEALWEREPGLCCAIRKVAPLGARARRPRRLDHRPAPRPVADARGRAEARLGRRPRALEGKPARRLGRRALLRLLCRARPALQRAARPRLRLDRLHPLHAPGARARGPLGRASTRPSAACTPSPDAGQAAREARAREPQRWRAAASCSGSPASRPPASRRSPRLVAARARERAALLVERLDGDVVREHLSKGLGFSKADRDTNIERIGWVASRLARAGAAVVVSAISPYEEARRRARALTEEHAPFVEVHVATSLEECARRDPKGLYAMAYAGEIAGFTGVSDPYEEPRDPELRLETEGRTPEPSRPPSCSRSSRSSACSSDEVRGVSALDATVAPPTLSHLDELEAEAIHIMREVAAERERPVLLFSGGKDSIVLLRLAEKAFRPGRLPVPGHAHRHGPQLPRGDRLPRPPRRRARRAAVVASVQDSIDRGRVVEQTGPRASRNQLQTTTLLDAIAEHGFDAAMGGARRDEERARAKERIFSFRDEFGQWNPRAQRPGALEPLQRPHPQGRAHPRLPDLELDRARRLAVHRPRAARAALDLLRPRPRRSSAATGCSTRSPSYVRAPPRRGAVHRDACASAPSAT